jgi:hypothetical protein
MAPTCCCGCGERLEVSKNPDRQKLFKPGHDGRLHALLKRVMRGEATRQKVPAEARANLGRIKFIQTDRELKKAFANPGQQTLRRKAKAQD